ncbi:MAG: hypothetical protein II680_06000 [Clostridia bacterium]|nr:hypothetical protein [Clostridia bacterium]
MKTRISFLAAVLALVLALSSCSGAAFVSENWKKADPSERTEMAESLKRDYDLVGWTEADVIRLLGPETPADPDRTCSLKGYDAEDTLVYALGADDYADVKMLVITLDRDRIVKKWEIVRISM